MSELALGATVADQSESLADYFDPSAVYVSLIRDTALGFESTIDGYVMPVSRTKALVVWTAQSLVYNVAPLVRRQAQVVAKVQPVMRRVVSDVTMQTLALQGATEAFDSSIQNDVLYCGYKNNQLAPVRRHDPALLDRVVVDKRRSVMKDALYIKSARVQPIAGEIPQSVFFIGQRRLFERTASLGDLVISFQE